MRITKAEIEKGTPVICEASFDFNGLYCAVDILRKNGDGDEIEHEIHWNATQQKNWMKSRKGFLLTGDYICNWKNYCTDSTYKNAKTFKEFKYLITEIK